MEDLEVVVLNTKNAAEGTFEFHMPKGGTIRNCKCFSFKKDFGDHQGRALLKARNYAKTLAH